MHRRGGDWDILLHTKKKQAHRLFTEPNLDSAHQFFFVETDESVFQKTSKNFNKQGKYVIPAHAAHTHATLPKYFAGIVH